MLPPPLPPQPSSSTVRQPIATSMPHVFLGFVIGTKIFRNEEVFRIPWIWRAQASPGSDEKRRAQQHSISFYLSGLLIQWSVKVECWMEDSILGMWQVVQFFVLTGQAAPG